MALLDIERLHYYPRQYLGSVDLEDQQTYLRDMRRRHNLAHHAWGIVVGLELEEQPRLGSADEIDIYVKPGLAIDGFGREIVVLAPYKLDTADFAVFGTQRYVELWIAYDEELYKQAGPGYAQCVGAEQFTRIRETFRIVPAPDPPTHDPIMVDGQPATRRADVDPSNPPTVIIPDDESVPYQELPDDADSPNWLVRLGSVNWDGTRKPPAFVKDKANRLLEERTYAGLVGKQLIAPATALIMRDRNTPTPLPDDDKIAGVAAVVEGSLQINRLLTTKRDIQVHGGKLDLRDGGGDDGGAPFLFYRSLAMNAQMGNDLRVALGKTSDGKHNFVVGPEQGGTLDTKFAVRNDGQVRINGPLSISGIINFDNVLGDRIVLWGSAGTPNSYALGIENGTLYARANSRHRWYVGASADDGASAYMQLTNTQLRVVTDLQLKGILDFDEIIGDRLMLWGPNDDPTAYGLGIEGGTLYAKSNIRYRWYINHNRDDGPSAKMELDSTTLRVKTDLTVSQDTTISGNLRVLGTQNIIRIEQQTFAVKNAGTDTPGTWTMNYAGKFAQTPTVFVVFQGFSLFDYDGNPSFTPDTNHHVADAGAIPQHVYTRVSSVGINSASGVCYCSESSFYALDNTVLFTVVAIGRSV